MANTSRWHEVEYRVDAINEALGVLCEHGNYLLDWVKQSPTNTEMGEPSEVPEAALQILVDYELFAAQELDRLENERAATATSYHDTAWQFADSLGSRLQFLEAGAIQLEDITDWIESFRNTHSTGLSFSGYELRTIAALEGYLGLVRAAIENGENAASMIPKLRLAETQRQKDEENARSQEARTQAEQEHQAREQAAQVEAARLEKAYLESERVGADQRRTSKELASILKGNWHAQVADPYGIPIDMQEIELKGHLLGHDEYHAMSPATGWGANASWVALDGTHVRLVGMQRAPMGVPVGISETLTFSVIDDDHLESVTTQGLRMSWSRK